MTDEGHKQAFAKEALGAKFKQQIAAMQKTNVQHDVAPLHPNLLESEPKIDVRITEHQQDQKIHHFKLMQMRTHEDNQNGFTEVDLLYHFAFPKFKKHPKMDDDGDYAWDIKTNP